MWRSEVEVEEGFRGGREVELGRVRGVTICWRGEVNVMALQDGA